MVRQTTFVRHASDIDLTYDQDSPQIQVLGSWTNRVRMNPDCKQSKAEIRTFRCKKSACSKQSAVDTAPESSRWNQQFRQKWRREQIRGRRRGIANSPDSSEGSLDAPDTEQADDLIFGIDDVHGAVSSTDGSASPSAIIANCSAVQQIAVDMVPLLKQQQPVIYLPAAWRGEPTQPTAVSASKPIAIGSRRAAPQTALQQQLHLRQQQAGRHQQPMQKLQQPTQLRQQPSGPQLRQPLSVWHSAAAASSSSIRPPTSPTHVSRLPLRPEATNANASSDICANRSDRSSASGASVKTSASSIMAPEQAAMLQAAGLPPIRRVIMRGSSGKLKAQARMYKPELPPKHYCASQAA